jgi:hypothetical protein
MGDSFIPAAPAVTGLQRRNRVDDIVDSMQSGRPPATPQAGAPPPAAAPQPANVHPGVLQAIQNGIANLFGMGAPQPAAAPPAMADGGVVTARPNPNLGSTGVTYEPRAGGVLPTWEGKPNARAGDGGALAAPGDQSHPPGDSPAAQKILTMDGGGAVPSMGQPDSAQPPPRSVAPLPTTPGWGTAALAGYQAAQNMNIQRDEAQRYKEQYKSTQDAHDAIESYAGHLNDASLPDGAGPQPAQGIPTDPGATQVAQQAAGGDASPADTTSVGAVAAAAKSPGAQAGKAQQSPEESGKTHSLTNEWWDESNNRMMTAMRKAVHAGYDPNKVMESLTAMRNGFLQSNILKNLSAANKAVLSGDNDEVEKAMHNLYYYFPDGRDLKVKRGENGEVQYQDPVYPFLDQDGNPTASSKFHGEQNKPNFTAVTPEHLSLLATAAMDPTKLAGAITNTRSAAAKAALEAQEGEAKLETAQGARMTGEGRKLAGEARFGEMASTNVKNLSAAQLDQARAVTSGWALRRLQLQAQSQKLDPSILKGADAAANAVDEQFMGRKITAPLTDQAGEPSLSPAAGKVVHDPGSVPKELQGATSIDVANAKGMAAELYAAGARTGMTPQQAAQLSLRAHMGKSRMHKVPAGSKNDDGHDVQVHPELGRIFLWDGAKKKFDSYPINPEAAQGIAAGGVSSSELATMASGGQGAPQQGAIPNPADQDLDNSGP